MSKEIKLRSRYGDTHTLVPVPEVGENTYRYVPAQEWMPMRYIFDGDYREDVDEFDLTAVDTDGGPFLSVGDKVDGMEIKRIYVTDGFGTLIEF
ncbi:MAG: hypothetical protein J6X18_04440 [Bacteroidales bacterium]|nr:hypothetical protein [Bacteroidales bacterium]